MIELGTSMSKWKRGWAVVGVGALTAMLVVSAPASAAAPANDDFADATASALSWATTVDTSGATLQEGEPSPDCGVDVGATVWYRFDAEPGQDLHLWLDAVDHQGIATLWRGSTLHSLEHVACLWGDGGRWVYDVHGGTYHVQLGGSYGEAGPADLGVDLVVPPPNDERADATEVTSVPYHDDGVDIINATLEDDEPVPCLGQADLMKSIWYRYRPETDVTLSAATDHNVYAAVWQEHPDGSLTELACQFGTETQTLVVPGRSYLIQIATSWQSPITYVDVTIDVPLSAGDILDVIRLP